MPAVVQAQTRGLTICRGRFRQSRQRKQCSFRICACPRLKRTQGGVDILRVEKQVGGAVDVVREQGRT